MEHPPPREAEVIWRDGDVPISARRDEARFGDADAPAEKRHVFIEGKGPAFDPALRQLGLLAEVAARSTPWATIEAAGFSWSTRRASGTRRR